MAKLPAKRPETLGGFIVHGVPFPVDSDPESLAFLKKLSPIQIEQEYKITYLHSYGQEFLGTEIAHRECEIGRAHV